MLRVAQRLQVGVTRAQSQRAFLDPARFRTQLHKQTSPLRSSTTCHSLNMANLAAPLRTGLELVTEHLETPALDDRSYRVIRLPNQLEALIVHDPDSDKASAAMDVNVGSFSDRPDMPGMAHAVEHLLFMGTEKYPKENAYNQFLTSHSGFSNAYTAATSTNYYFEVAATKAEGSTEDVSPLHGALDRFAQFFIAPLFLSSTLDRELQAVDSENKKNLQNDQWRLNQLSKHLTNPKHPYCTFSTGNLQTLRDIPKERGIDVRDEFMKFHGREYSANRMKLVVLGREKLDELEKWVVELFSEVPNKDLKKLRWDDELPFTKDFLLKQYFAKPVMDTRALEITFPFVDEEAMYETQPSRYLSHLIGHEGPGSILALVKAKGWANSLDAGAASICPGAGVFSVEVRLTEEGLKNYLEIVKIVFQYISLIKAQPPQEWIFNELQGMAAVDFKFKQKSTASKFTSKIARVMQKPLPREYLLSGTALMRKFDAQAISSALEYLRTDNFRLAITSQVYPGGWDQKEKWYGTEYKTEPLPKEFVQSLKEQRAIEELHLPHKNEFIPTNLHVEKKEVKEPAKAPKLLRRDELVRLWWKKDDTFWVPKGNVSITLRSPLASATPKNAIKSRLFCELVQDALNEYSYDADIAGLAYSLSCHSLGLDIDLSGYNDKMPVLLEKVLTSMCTLDVKEDRFEIMKERLHRGHKNWELAQPYHQIGEYTRWLNLPDGWVNVDYLEEIPHITAEDVRSFYPQLLQQLHVEVFVHGNFYKEDALNIAQLIENTLKPRPLHNNQWKIRRSLAYAPGANYSYQYKLKDPANVNHAVEYFLYVGLHSDRPLRARLLLLAQMLDEPIFDQLRTKEQLGYVVFSGPRMGATTMGFRVLIQSERTPEYLDGRIDEFLQEFGPTLEAMDPADFEKQKRSLIHRRLESLKNLNDENDRLWDHIESEFFDFHKVDHDVAHLTPLTKADILSFYKTYIDPASPTRAKLSIQLVAQASAAAVTDGTTAEEQKEKLTRLIVQNLNSQGVGCEVEALQTRFADLNLADCGQEDVMTALAAHLSEDLHLPSEAIDKIREEGSKLMALALPNLGIELPVVRRPSITVREPSVLIEDVRAFKTRQSVTAGAYPISDLSEFEETGAKL